MRDILPDVERWLGEGKAVAVATITKTWGSSPRAVGSKMAVCTDGAMAGSVSGGYVESAVVQEALQVLKSGKPKQLHYGVSDDQAWEVGLACGGQIDLLVEPLSAWRAAAAGKTSAYETLKALREERPVGSELSYCAGAMCPPGSRPCFRGIPLRQARCLPDSGRLPANSAWNRSSAFGRGC